MSSARSVSIARMPRSSSASLSPISSDSSDLTLITSVASCSRAMPATIEFASAPSRAQWTVPPAAVTRSSSRSSCSGRVAIARALIAAPASRSASQSGSSPTARRRLTRIAVVALPTLRRSWASASAVRAAAGKPAVIPAPPGSRRCASSAHPPAGARSAPPMCIRQDVSTAVQTSARVSSTRRSLSPSMAIETSAFLTAKVPPKPQHSSASSSSTRSIPRTARSSRCGRSPMCSARTEWQVGCSVTRCGNDASVSSTPSTSTRNSVSSYTGGPPGRRSRTKPTHEALGETIASAPSNTRANRSSSGRAASS